MHKYEYHSLQLAIYTYLRLSDLFPQHIWQKRMGYSPTLSNCPRTAAVARPFLRFFSVLSLETSLESIILRSPYMPPHTPSISLHGSLCMASSLRLPSASLPPAPNVVIVDWIDNREPSTPETVL